jgi:hypothetical protein
VVTAFIDLVAADREAAGNVIVVRRYARHACGRARTANGGTNAHGIREGAMRCVETCLNEILALGLRDQRLQFGGSERVYQASFRDDEKKNLCSCECGKFVCLNKEGSKK